MSDYHAFHGRIEPLKWGDSTYTILRLPADVADALIADGARRVEGEIAEHPVNLALTKAPPVDGLFLYTGKTLLDAAGITPGDEIEVRLKKTDPAVVEVPDDIRRALRSSGTTDAWDAMTPGARRGRLAQIATAKRAETRAKRITALVRDLEAEA